MQTTEQTQTQTEQLVARGPVLHEEKESGWGEEEMADAEAGIVEAEDVTMVESMTRTTNATPTPSATGTATDSVSVISSHNGTGITIGHSPYDIRQRKWLWLTAHKGCALTMNERTDISKNAGHDVNVIKIEKSGENIK
jgi:hypothetical protein